jgi:Na+/H+ antiporter NhaD/arsenite permease-like protein
MPDAGNRRWTAAATLRWTLLLALSLLASLGGPLAGACLADSETSSARPADQHDAVRAAAGIERPHPHDEASHGALGQKLHLATVIPFAALLLCIAVLPLVTPHWWEHNSSKLIVVALLALPTAAYLLLVWGHEGAGHQLAEKLHEYVAFIVLLGALYVIAGGVYIRGSLSGTPLANTMLLAIGGGIASFIGTTGASVLLIRPLLRANESRQARAHIVVFFIFVVSNCGGLLTPLGDPPLFLGFLKGVPFEWTAIHLWRHWLFVNAALLITFNVWDQMVFTREERERPGSQLEEVLKHEPLGIDGAFNFLFLAGVVAVIVVSGQIHLPIGLPEGLMVLLAAAAYLLTPKANRERNRFTFGPINEVAILFVGIFVTMIPALLILNAWGATDPALGREVLGVPFVLSEPWHYFWATGLLSSFLDNAPTYLALAAPACGQHQVAAQGAYLRELLTRGDDAVFLLKAISCGAVFMGANTYIGNGPNFMVKAIAEENGVRMPSFFGYMLYSAAVLLPLFVVVTLVFFR